MSREFGDLPAPNFCATPGSDVEGDSFGIQSGGSSPERAGFKRGFLGAPRPRLPLQKHMQCSRENPFPPGFLIHRPPRRAIPAGKKLGVGKNLRRRWKVCLRVVSATIRGIAGVNVRGEREGMFPKINGPFCLWKKVGVRGQTHSSANFHAILFQGVLAQFKSKPGCFRQGHEAVHDLRALAKQLKP